MDAAPRPAHPRPTRRDAAGRGRPLFRAASDRVVPRGKSRIGPTRSVSAETAESGRNSKKKKKKKGAKRTVWLNLNTQNPSDPPKHPLSLRPSSPFSVCSVPHLSSLCSELSVSAMCTQHCFSLQVCSLYSFLEFLFFVLYDFSLSNCLEMNLVIIYYYS